MLLVLSVVLSASLLTAPEASAKVTGFVAKWGAKGAGDGQFQAPVGVAVDGVGNVYVADSKNRRIQKFSSNGAFLGKWDTVIPGEQSGHLSPEGVAADGLGNVYVVFRGYTKIFRYNSDGALLDALAAHPEVLPPEGDAYYTVAAGMSGALYAGATRVDRPGEEYVQRLNPSGGLLAEWSASFAGTSTSGRLMEGIPLAVSPTGTVFVTTERTKVEAFTAEGAPLAQFGSPGKRGGQLRCAYGVAADGDDNLYVVDPCLHRVQKFSSTGVFLGKVGREGKGFGGSMDGHFSFPFGVAVDSTGNFYVADTFNNRIQKFSPDAFVGSDALPRLGSRVAATVVSGVVRVRRSGSRRFTRLKASETVPVGSLVDTLRGRVRIASAVNQRGDTQSAEFYDGVFRVLQGKKPGAVTEARLVGRLFGCAPGKGASASRKAKRRRPGRLLWGDGEGKHRTTGRNSSASVRGTRWLVWDRCNGSTSNRVTQGEVTVRDFVRKRTVLLRKGQRYVASPRRRGR